MACLIYSVTIWLCTHDYFLCHAESWLLLTCIGDRFAQQWLMVFCTPKAHLSATIKLHSLHLVSRSGLWRLNPFILFLILSLCFLHGDTSDTFTVKAFIPSSQFCLCRRPWHTCTHDSCDYLSAGQLLVGGSMKTWLIKNEKNPVKGAELGPSDLPAATGQNKKNVKQGFPKSSSVPLPPRKGVRLCPRERKRGVGGLCCSSTWIISG